MEALLRPTQPGDRPDSMRDSTEQNRKHVLLHP